MKYQDNVYIVKNINEINADELKEKDLIYIINNCSHIQLYLSKIKGQFYYFETDEPVIDGKISLNYNKIETIIFHKYININNQLFLIDSNNKEIDNVSSYKMINLFEETKDEEEVIFSEFIKLYQENTKETFKHKTLETHSENLKIIYNILKIKLDYQTFIVCQKFSYNIKYNNIKKSNFYLIIDEKQIKKQLDDFMYYTTLSIIHNKKSKKTKEKEIKKIELMALEKYFREKLYNFKYLNYFIKNLSKNIKDTEFLKFNKLLNLLNNVNMGRILDLNSLNKTIYHINQYFDIKELFNYITPVYNGHGFIGFSESNIYYKNKWINSIDNKSEYNDKLKNVYNICKTLMDFYQSSYSHNINPINGQLISGIKLYEDYKGIIISDGNNKIYYKKYLGYIIKTWDYDFKNELNEKYKLVEKLKTC